MPQTKELVLKSLTSLRPTERLETKLHGLGFVLGTTCTVVSDGKFWLRRLYRRREESISVSEEVGEVIYMRDPVVTFCTTKGTISEVRKTL